MRSLILQIFLIFFSVFCFGQKVNSKTYVQSLFEKQAKIQWIKHFKGRIDDMNDVSITLGFDGEKCIGKMTYLRSNVQFRLDGVIQGQEIFLWEMDDAENISGALEGKIKGKSILGTWSNHDGSKGGNLSLMEINHEMKFPSYCGDNKWIRKYEGLFSNQNVEILLQKESMDKVTGLIFFGKLKESYTIDGKVDQYDKLTIQVKNQEGRLIQKLTGDLRQDQLSLDNKNGKKVVFNPIDGLTIGCVEYADYTTGYDITFPKTTNAAFNRSMEEETDAWIKACRNHGKKINKQVNNTAPKFRSTERGYAWSEVDFFSNKMISGFMTFSNTWTPGQKLIAFNFDFEKNSNLYLEDIFEKDKDYNKYIKNYIKKEIKKHIYYKDSDFKKWIKKSDFPFFTIRKDGISFSTKSNMLYGRQSVTIPYRQLMPFLKKGFLNKIQD